MRFPFDRTRLFGLAVLLLALPLCVFTGTRSLMDASPQLPAVPADAPEQATRYAFILGGNHAGTLALWKTADGVSHSFYEFNDRGRGPQLRTQLVIGADGIPTSIKVTGHDYYKGPAEEHFSVENGNASWKNKAEQGSKQLSRKAFYASFEEGPDELGYLAFALLSSAGGSLDVLPEGETRIEKAGEETVEANGKTQKIFEYAISGLDFQPTSVWLDSQKQLFAAGQAWYATIREGWESNWPKLLKIQDAQEASREAKLTTMLARKPTGAVVIEHANLFDSESARVIPGTTVVVSGNRIQAVGPDGSVAIPKGAQELDATGKTLLPGLWDMHVHMGNGDGLLYIAAGVTTVRDMGNDIDKILALKKAYDSGAAVGPRVQLAGIIDGPGPYQGPTKVLVDTPEQARAAVDRYHSLGFEQTKIYSSVKPELVPVLIEESRRMGMRVSGHIPAFMTAEQAVREGYNEIQHINFLFLNFFDDVKETRTPARFTAVAERAASLDLNSERVQAFFALLKEKKVDIDPTINVFEGMFTAQPGKISPVFASVADRLPTQVRRGFLAGGLPVPAGMDQRYRDSFQATLNMVGKLYKEGIPIVAGTDDLAGFSLHRELELYVQAGIPAPAVLQIATLGAARIMKHDDERGSVAPGKLADLILVPGNPAEHISDIRRVETVMKDGVIYRVAEVDQSISVKP